MGRGGCPFGGWGRGVKGPQLFLWAASPLLKETRLPTRKLLSPSASGHFLPTRRSKAALHEAVFPNGNRALFAGCLSINIPVRDHLCKKMSQLC
jgi:hypothetical protein